MGFSKKKKSEGDVDDNYNKLYRFGSLPLIIFNHGVNKFNNKIWNDFCLDYEKSNEWDGLNLNDMCNNFKYYINDDVRKELKKNYNSHRSLEYLVSAFVFCGKANRNTKNKIIELFWSYESRQLEFQRIKHENLTRSGSGGKYLDEYLQSHSQIDTNEYWANLDIKEATEKLKNLFLIAVENKKNVGGDEFSDEFNFDSIEDCG